MADLVGRGAFHILTELTELCVEQIDAVRFSGKQISRAESSAQKRSGVRRLLRRLNQLRICLQRGASFRFQRDPFERVASGPLLSDWRLHAVDVNGRFSDHDVADFQRPYVASCRSLIDQSVGLISFDPKHCRNTGVKDSDLRQRKNDLRFVQPRFVKGISLLFCPAAARQHSSQKLEFFLHGALH